MKTFNEGSQVGFETADHRSQYLSVRLENQYEPVCRRYHRRNDGFPHLLIRGGVLLSGRMSVNPHTEYESAVGDYTVFQGWLSEQNDLKRPLWRAPVPCGPTGPDPPDA